MTFRPQDMARALEKAKKASSWESKLASANNLFHQGSSQYSAAASQYGKIVETLLRYLFQEISLILPPRDRANFLQLEVQIGRGAPFGNFGLGQMIGFFSGTGIFTLLNSYLKDTVFIPMQLNKINDFRIDQTHYDEEIEKTKVDDIRKDVTSILLRLNLITRDPEIAQIAQVEALKEKEAQKEETEGLRRILTKIRCGLLENSTIDFWSVLDRQDGWSAQLGVKADIAGVYMNESGCFTAVVIVRELETPEGEDEEAYQQLSSKVREMIRGIAPEVEGKLEIAYFPSYYKPGIESSAYAYSDKDEVLGFS